MRRHTKCIFARLIPSAHRALKVHGNALSVNWSIAMLKCNSTKGRTLKVIWSVKMWMGMIRPVWCTTAFTIHQDYWVLIMLTNHMLDRQRPIKEYHINIYIYIYIYIYLVIKNGWQWSWERSSCSSSACQLTSNGSVPVMADMCLTSKLWSMTPNIHSISQDDRT